jgi:hypothetical protein
MPNRVALILLHMLVVAAAALPTLARAAEVCIIFEMQQQKTRSEECVEMCQFVMRLPAKGQTVQCKYFSTHPRFTKVAFSGSPKDANRTPSNMTSCEATAAVQTPAGPLICTLKVCGDVKPPKFPPPRQARPPLTPNVSNLRVMPKPPAGPPQPPNWASPGLLENDSGFARQGPSAGGSTLGGAGGAAPPSKLNVYR